MNITKDTAVTITYKIHELLQGGLAGKLLDKGDVAYLHGGYDNLFAKVEAALEGKQKGDAVTVDLAVEDGFGARDESLQRTIPKGEFPPGVKVGGQLRGTNDQGQPQIYQRPCRTGTQAGCQRGGTGHPGGGADLAPGPPPGTRCTCGQSRGAGGCWRTHGGIGPGDQGNPRAGAGSCPCRGRMGDVLSATARGVATPRAP